MEQLYGIFLYGVFLLTMGGIYAVLTLGLNIQWGFTGLFNAGVAGFFAIGAYTTAIVTSAASERHLGGFGLTPAAGMVAAMIALLMSIDPILDMFRTVVNVCGDSLCCLFLSDTDEDRGSVVAPATD